MDNWQLVFTKQAEKDTRKLVNAGLAKQTAKLLDILKENPYQSYPSYEKLSGDLAGYYSRRINIQHRLIYQVFPKEKIVKIIRMWTHYE
ncbi:MAG: Txe/YoeB family addiction module toxin [Crocosphaera sp.]|jgi:toxin YoeB